jgi:hypothetical protein
VARPLAWRLHLPLPLEWAFDALRLSSPQAIGAPVPGSCTFTAYLASPQLKVVDLPLALPLPSSLPVSVP